MTTLHTHTDYTDYTPPLTFDVCHSSAAVVAEYAALQRHTEEFTPLRLFVFHQCQSMPVDYCERLKVKAKIISDYLREALSEYLTVTDSSGTI